MLFGAGSMNRADWDKGLPYDVMAIMMEAAPGSTLSTRVVSKTWQISADGLVTKLKIPYQGPVPKSFFKLGDRFPALTSLDVGASLLDVHQTSPAPRASPSSSPLTLGARKSPGANLPHHRVQAPGVPAEMPRPASCGTSTSSTFRRWNPSGPGPARLHLSG